MNTINMMAVIVVRSLHETSIKTVRSIFLFPSIVVDWNRRGREEWRTRVAQGYCSACGREKFVPNYKTCDDFGHAVYLLVAA